MCVSLCQCARGRCGVGWTHACLRVLVRLPLSMNLRCVHAVCGFPSVFVSFCVSPQLCSVLRHRGASSQGSVGLWHGLWSRMGSWVRAERGAFPHPTPTTPWAFQEPVLRDLV